MACFAREDTPNPPISGPDWSPGETVTLRPRYDWGIESQAQFVAMRVPDGLEVAGKTPAEIAQVMQQTVDGRAAQQYVFEQMIVAWTLTYDDGEPAPLGPEMIARLPKGYADFISAEIYRRGGGLSPADQTGPQGDPTRLRSASPSEASSLTALAPSSNARSQKPVSLKS